MVHTASIKAIENEYKMSSPEIMKATCESKDGESLDNWRRFYRYQF
jgi:hypothetical protein